MQHSSSRQPWIALTTLTLLTGLLGALGCEPPVSDEATLTITGRVLNADGTPAANQKVDLYKSDLPLFESDTLIGYSIAVGTPFQTAQTDADGNYRIVLSGAEANTSSQKFAAYFGVSVTQGSDRQLAVASYSFQFSNQDLSEALPEMRFWDSGAVAVEGEELTFTWDAPPTPTRSGEVHVALPGVWLDAVEGGRYSLSTLALPFEGEAQGFELIAVSDQLRYRTSLKPFTASNPRGAGLDYSQPLNNNISGTDCEGKNLFDLNDGIFAGDSGVELFGQSTRDGARGVQGGLPPGRRRHTKPSAMNVIC
jgi:hypothetical protein